MIAGTNDIEQRLLILAPIGRDATAAAQLLEAAGIACVTCRNLEDLCRKLGAYLLPVWFKKARPQVTSARGTAVFRQRCSHYNRIVDCMRTELGRALQ